MIEKALSIDKEQRFLVCSPNIDIEHLNRQTKYQSHGIQKRLMMIPMIILLSIFGLVKVIHLFCMQRSDKSFENIANIVLKSESDHMHQNFFTLKSSDDFILVEEFNKKSFTNLLRVPLKIIFKQYVLSIKQLYKFSKNISYEFFLVIYLNIFKSIAIYAYWNALFILLKNKNDRLMLFCPHWQSLAACAASNTGFNSTFISHGLIGKFYTMPSFNKAWVYSRDEKEALQNFLTHSEVNIYNSKKIYNQNKSVLIILSSIENQMNEEKLIDIARVINKRNYSILIKLHPSNPNSKVAIKLKNSFSNVLILKNNVISSVISELKPYFCIGWTSTGLCESLNMGIVPISLSDKDDEYLNSMVYKSYKRSLFWPKDIQIIKSLLDNDSGYNNIIEGINS